MLLEKLTQLKNRFFERRGEPQDIGTIDSWISEAKKLFLLNSLKNHDGIKYVLEIFKSEVSKIDSLLSNSYSKDLPDRERDRLLDKRDLAKKYINLFDNIEEKLDKLEELVDKES